MNNPIGGIHIKEDDVGTGSAGLELDELVPGHTDLLPGCCVEVGGAGREVLALHSGVGNHVPQQHLLQLLLVSQQTVELVHWDLEGTN